ncbi:MAG: hypothetical protein HYS13_21370 [Planctomycetia bacterium]|nr:hypothetical protein [Planctomycetia bacterium]
MSLRVHAVGRPEIPPLLMPDRFRLDIAYFMSVPDEGGVPQLPTGEYWVRRDDAKRWLEEGVIPVVSPLDSQNQTEVEISDEQQDWLEWMVDHAVEHIRLE